MVSTKMKNRLLKWMPKSLKIGIKRIAFSPARFQEDQEQQEVYRLSKLPRYQPDETVLFGKKIKILDWVSYFFICDEVLKKEIYKFRSATPNPYIIDGGANIGISIVYFKRMYPDAKITAFEPDSAVLDVLRFNVGQFNFQDVKIIPKGLWSSDTSLSFYSEGADAGRVSTEPAHNLITIETTRLSAYLTERVDFLKLDIEGAEWEVLQEAKERLANVERIFVEYHSFEGKEQCLPEILALLKDAGFRVYLSTPAAAFKNPFLEVSTYLGMDLQLNVFGVRFN